MRSITQYYIQIDYYNETGARQFHARHKQNAEKVKSIFTESQAVTYLEDSSVRVRGINFYGSPWQPEFFGANLSYVF